MPRPPLDIDPDWLRERFKMPGATAKAIAAEIGHHPTTIGSHARRLGIRLRAPWPDRSEFDEVWLRRRYVDDKAKVRDIAAEAGVCCDVVQKAIRRYGLTGQGRGTRRRIRPTNSVAARPRGGGAWLCRRWRAGEMPFRFLDGRRRSVLGWSLRRSGVGRCDVSSNPTIEGEQHDT